MRGTQSVAIRDEAQVRRALELYADTLRRICFLHLKNRSDVEDVFQEVMLKYILHTGGWESDRHEKAWLMRVAINACKDVLKSSYRRRVFSLETADQTSLAIEDEDRAVLDAVLRLPDVYRDAVYLFYYEGYTAREIASLLGKRENTIYSRLDRARERLRRQLGGEDD